MRYVKIDANTILKGKGLAGICQARSIGKFGAVDRSGRVIKVMEAGFEPPKPVGRRDRIEAAILQDRMAASKRAFFARPLTHRPFATLKLFKLV